MSYQKNRVLAPHGWSAYDLLLDAGVTHPLAQLATPAMAWTPGESDPSSQSTMIVVQGIQRMLKKRGIRTPMNGYLDSATQGALAQAGGRSWRSEPWFHLYEQLRLKSFRRLQALSGLGDTFVPKEDAIYGSLPANEIVCNDTTNVCKGTTPRVVAAFKALQSAVGVTVDGVIGPRTVTATIAAIGPRWQGDDTTAKVYTTWNKSKRTFAVAAYADKIAAFLGKPVSVSKPPSTPPSVSTSPATLRPPASPFTPTTFGPVQSAGLLSGNLFGVPVPLVAGAALIGGLLFFQSRGPSKPTKKKRATRRKPARRRAPARRRR